jgi:hypothetical protein
MPPLAGVAPWLAFWDRPTGKVIIGLTLIALVDMAIIELNRLHPSFE